MDIKCVSEVVEHAFQAKVTQSEEDTEKTRVMHYGDMPDADRKARPYYERILAADKHRTVRKQTCPFPFLDEMLLVGTNAHGAYALKGSVECIGGYKNIMIQYERNSIIRSLKHDLKHVRIVKDAKRKWEYVVALMSNDDGLKKLLMPFLNAFKKKIDTLPVSVDNYHGGTVLEPRPGEELPVVRCMTTRRMVKVYDDTVDNFQNAPIKSEEYAIWFCDPNKNSNHWQQTKLNHIECAEGEVPNVAFNDEYLVIIFHPPSFVETKGSDLLCAQVYKCGATGRPAAKPEYTHHFEFPEEHFTPSGIYQVHLSTENILSVGCANGAIVFDILNTIELPRLILLKTKDEEENRLVTSVQIFHPQGRKRPDPKDGDDDWDEKYINQDGMFDPVLSEDKEEDAPPEWSGILVLGTSVGECIGMSWRNGKIHFIELTPACEPIYSCLYSNQRIVMHCVGSLSAKLLPYFHDGITQLEMARPRAVAILGTQVYVLDKYGHIQILSTLARNIVSPFKPPSVKVHNDETEEDEYKDIDIGLTTPCQPAYPGLYVNQTRIRALYANGVLDTIDIDRRAQSLIEEKVYGNKKKQQKKKEKKEKKQKQKQKKNTTRKKK